MAKKKLNQLDPEAVTLSRIFGHADPATGIMKRASFSQLVALFDSLLPSVSFSDITEMLADTELAPGQFAYVADASEDDVAISGWSLYLYLGPDQDDLTNYVLIASQRNKHMRGNWDLRAGYHEDEYPSEANDAIGSGPLGDVQEGDKWVVPIGGEGSIDLPGIGLTAVNAGTTIEYIGGDQSLNTSYKVVQS